MQLQVKLKKKKKRKNSVFKKQTNNKEDRN